MLELYQAEWCPHSRAVRQRLTELGVDFVARQVPARPGERQALRDRTGLEGIPVAVLEDGTVIDGEDAIIAHLDATHEPGAGARAHAAKARVHAEG
jgi:glutathione S-transferase